MVVDARNPDPNFTHQIRIRLLIPTHVSAGHGSTLTHSCSRPGSFAVALLLQRKKPRSWHPHSL